MLSGGCKAYTQRGPAGPHLYIHITRLIIKNQNHKIMMTVNVMRFLQLQDQVNNQIDQYGQAEIELVGELELLGDQLTADEIAIACTHLDEYEQYDEMEYEDIEGWVE